MMPVMISNAAYKIQSGNGGADAEQKCAHVIGMGSPAGNSLCAFSAQPRQAMAPFKR